jgi:hypothetical protein
MARVLSGLLIVLGLIVGTFALAPADAQDATADRVTALETSVADQQDEISGLRKRVKRLEAVVLTPQTGSDEGPPPQAGDGTVELSGTGIGVTEGFALSPGRYRVKATVQTAGFTGFALILYGSDDFEDLVFNEIVEEPGTWEGQAVVEIETAGEYFAEIQNTEATWTIVFEPL